MKLKGLFADGMVFLRNAKNCIAGTAEPKSTVTVKFLGGTYSVRADWDGNWDVVFTAGAACGPETMEITCSDGSAVVLKDLYVGEVWLNCGQSNAQLPMERLKYTYREDMALPENPLIRMCTVPIRYTFGFEQEFVDNPTWLSASPETLGGFSGTAYFFAKRIQAELGCAVGIINASQGGSPIASWMDKKSLANFKKYIDYIQNANRWEVPGKIESEQKRVDLVNGEVESLFQNDAGYKENWQSLSFEEIKNDDSWQTVTIPGTIRMLDFAGTVWLKKEVELTAEQVKAFDEKKTHLWLGTFRDADETYVNGVHVGGTPYIYPPRRYVIPSGTLKAGKNTVTIRARQNGPLPLHFFLEKNYKIFTDDAKIVPVALRNCEQKESVIPETAVVVNLEGEWKAKVGCKVNKGGASLFLEWEPTALFNGMLAPCFFHAIRGAVWYQGESDAGRFDEYSGLLQNMVKLWRKRFTFCPEDYMPFVAIELPGWCCNELIPPSNMSVRSEWAALRESQNDGCDSLVNASVAVYVDGGEWNDLHPEKKLTCGTRAAEQAMRLAYGLKFETEPKVEAFEENKEGWKICYNKNLTAWELNKTVDAGLFTDRYTDFTKKTTEVAGFSFLFKDGTTALADAVLSGSNEVQVKCTDTASVAELRYLWNDCPSPINLYGETKLPARTWRAVFAKTEEKGRGQNEVEAADKSAAAGGAVLTSMS